MSEFDDPTREEPEEDSEEQEDVEGQTGGLYGGAEDFKRDPARSAEDGPEEDDEATELGGE